MTLSSYFRMAAADGKCELEWYARMCVAGHGAVHNTIICNSRLYNARSKQLNCVRMIDTTNYRIYKALIVLSLSITLVTFSPTGHAHIQTSRKPLLLYTSR